MDSLHAEPCEPQTKIDTFIHAIKHSFPSPTMDPEKREKSTKQTQTTEQNPSNNTKKTANSETDDTDSAYNTESESSYAAHLPRPSKSQQITNTKCNQGTKPSRIPAPNHTKSNSKTSHISTSTHLPKPSMSTPETSHLSTSTHQTKPKTSTASTYPQHTRKTPLLPTPPASTRTFNYSNHFNQHISGPSASRHNTYSAFSRPSTFSSRKQHISRPIRIQQLQI